MHALTPARLSGARLWAAAACTLLLATRALAADPAARAAESAPGKERAVTLETVAGSSIKRVVLSAKAAERLDVQTREVAEQVIVPTLMVGGIVVDPSASARSDTDEVPPAKGGSGAGKAPAEVWVRVALSPLEWDKLAKDKPVRLLPLSTRAGLAKDLTATLAPQPPQEVAKSGMSTLFFVARMEGSGLVIGDRVRVQLQQKGSSEPRKVVPYSAVYYDAKGVAWVYVNAAPLAFLREKITIDRVVGDLAVLSSGPAVGTKVASVGAALLYGAEIFGK